MNHDTPGVESLKFHNTTRFDQPWPHFHVGQVLSHEMADRLLTWLETTDLFLPRREEFYRSSAFHLSPQNVPDHLSDFVSTETLKALMNKVEQLFGINFHERFSVSANRYGPSQGTLIHTDYVDVARRDEYFFTHRFLIYLNRDWQESNGGWLGLFNSANESDLAKTVAPANNTGIGLVISPRSYHAVSAVTRGNRYTLNFTFRSRTEDSEE